ncbi:4853_t:CDS:1 [Dentiscutata heterogama]|uniref:4853_t:CDS:1 n=1 Tax=Dentiscutata heterogama TaxID=1316150 RepID=A0ACA9KXY9_9GLOM|nr:4853_t:CDS:1 [Dentiscutata heterogama]
MSILKISNIFRASIILICYYIITFRLLEDLTLINRILSSPKIQKSYNDEKFLTYLPHSGFNNQLISLKNAIILSYITNRTLIMPSVIIDKEITHSEFDRLYSKLERSVIMKKARLSSCSHRTNETTNIKDFCHKSHKHHEKFSLMYWDDLLDFTTLKKRIRIINRGHEFDLETLKKSFESIYYIKENSRYGYQYFDMDNMKRSLGKQFKKKFLISEFISRPEKLIHFGSLHGSRRVILDDMKNKEFLNEVKESLRFNHPELNLCIERIINELGGLKNYIGVHIRTGERRIGDEMFRIQANNTIKPIFDRVNHYFLNERFNNTKCQHPIVFLATDAKNPNRTFRTFYSKFSPCIFSLTDFKHHLNIFNNIKAYDNYKLKNFFMPLVDLLVASSGGHFVGTDKSTFSKMAKEIHDFQIA